jgi:hypothetical protein
MSAIVRLKNCLLVLRLATRIDRKRGARTDEDCINEVCELISRGITASAATEFVGLPWSTWHAWIRRNHCQAKEKHDLAYDFHLEAMADKIHRVYLEIRAKREKALEAYYKRYDACNKLDKDVRSPREPQYRGPAEWELKAAEDQVKAWQWHLELRHKNFQRKHQIETTQNISVLQEINIRDARTPEEAMKMYTKLIDARPE